MLIYFTRQLALNVKREVTVGSLYADLRLFKGCYNDITGKLIEIKPKPNKEKVKVTLSPFYFLEREKPKWNFRFLANAHINDGGSKTCYSTSTARDGDPHGSRRRSSKPTSIKNVRNGGLATVTSTNSQR